MNEIYWITRLDYVQGLSIALVVICSILVIGAFICFMTSDKEKDPKEHGNANRLLKIFTPILVFAILCLMFVPNTREGLVIYGVGGTIDYIKSNEKAKQLPDKVVDALDKYLDSINEPKKE